MAHTTFLRLLCLGTILLTNPVLVPALAQDNNATDGSSSRSTSNSTGSTAATAVVTRVVQIFYIGEQVHDGQPYTLAHRDSGAVVAINDDLTTYVVTTTRLDQQQHWPKPSATDSVSVSDTNTISPGSTTPTTLPTSWSRKHGGGSGSGSGGPPFGTGTGTGTGTSPFFSLGNATGQPSTITQGPATFMYTGTRNWPNHTIINQCSLNGTAAAACNITHVGSLWYAKDPRWNGTYSTYSYDWTSGDRFGFAPVTITEGVGMLSATGTPTASGGGVANGAGGSVRDGRRLGMAMAMVGGVVGVVVLCW
ncbi:hypothetical protein B0T17DRAFT_507258 [Bombardia bombarda]|uniref:Uncharacterized protein n=1 Tax=Bombardia bombarda TaxID=252184 RepID=A0AA39XCA9_9PEZI|nr:hypothetical protein B0T17DRAFT_507258 [Bombardia bombarda]